MNRIKALILTALAAVGVAGMAAPSAEAYFHTDAAATACAAETYDSADATFRLYGKRASHTQWQLSTASRVSDSRVNVKIWRISTDFHLGHYTWCDISGSSVLDTSTGGHYFISYDSLHSFGMSAPIAL